MTWHTEIIPQDALSAVLGTIRRAGGTVTSIVLSVWLLRDLRDFR